LIFYVDNCSPAAKHDPQLNPPIIGLSLTALKEAVFAGIDQCMIDLHANPAQYPKTNDRLNWMFMCGPFKGTNEET